MSKILMVQLQAAPYTGTAYLCGAARSAGHEFALQLYGDEGGLERAIRRERPDIVGFSCMTGIHADAIRVAAHVKATFPGLPVAMGGPHPTFYPEVVENPAVDVVCRGEGEEALIELLDALGNGWDRGVERIRGIRNLHVKWDGRVTKAPQRPLADPLDALPMIDWSCYAGTAVEKSAPVAFPIRGCPYGCTYCFNAQYHELYRGLGRSVRAFGVERALKEVEAAIGVFAKSPVLFTSDTFGTDPEWMEKFLDGYEKLTDLPFVVLLRPELATDEVIRILSRRRCHSVAVGVESGSERVRKDVLNRKYSNERLLGVASSLHAAGIRFRTYNMIGIPSETEREIWETIELNVAMRTDYPRGAIFTPMPGTKLTEMAKEMGYLDRRFSFDEVPKTILAESILKGVDRERLKNLLYFFQTAVIFPKAHGMIRWLVTLRPNVLFRLWFYVVYTYLHRKSEGRGFWSYVRYVVANRRYR